MKTGGFYEPVDFWDFFLGVNKANNAYTNLKGLCILFWYLAVENGKSVIMGTVVSKSGAVQIYISK